MWTLDSILNIHSETVLPRTLATALPCRLWRNCELAQRSWLLSRCQLTQNCEGGFGQQGQQGRSNAPSLPHAQITSTDFWKDASLDTKLHLHRL